MQHKHFRCEDDLWNRSKSEAENQGTTISTVLRQFLTEFAAGRIDYGPQRQRQRPPQVYTHR